MGATIGAALDATGKDDFDLTAVLSGPRDIPTEEWLPPVFGKPEFEDDAEVEQMAELVVALHRLIAGQRRRLLAEGVEVVTPYGATEALPVCTIGSREILSETDTELIAQLLGRAEGSLEDRVIHVMPRLAGHFAVVAVTRDEPDTVVAFRHGPPLVVGLGDGESIVASDVTALLHRTRRVIFLENGDVAVVRPALDRTPWLRPGGG